MVSHASVALLAIWMIAAGRGPRMAGICSNADGEGPRMVGVCSADGEGPRMLVLEPMLVEVGLEVQCPTKGLGLRVMTIQSHMSHLTQGYAN